MLKLKAQKSNLVLTVTHFFVIFFSANCLAAATDSTAVNPPPSATPPLMVKAKNCNYVEGDHLLHPHYSITGGVYYSTEALCKPNQVVSKLWVSIQDKKDCSISTTAKDYNCMRFHIACCDLVVEYP